MAAEREVRIRRHSDGPDCDVIVSLQGDELLIRCRTYNQAVMWAQMECKSYRIAEFSIEADQRP
jgi:hypothetical protein